MNGIEPALNLALLRTFSARLCAERPDRLALKLHPLSGGLEARSVVRVEVTFSDRDRPRVSFAVKCITDSQAREIAAYRMLARAGIDIAPQLLGIDRAGGDTTYLYLEWIDSYCRWPWTDPANAGSVLRQLARIHNAGSVALPSWLTDWEYDTQLRHSAESTIEAFANASRHDELRHIRWRRRALDRIANALPAIRRRLMAGAVLLHGDAHSGNVAVRKRGDSLQAVLFDWSRIRIGSALEDVSSWLQSLGYWEWQARRRHDTLLQAYLAARGLPPVLTGELRELYWLAGACNALSGALRYHLSFVNERCPAPVRAEHARAARDWLRIVRRADACWHC